MVSLEEGSCSLHFEGKILEPSSVERNMVGICDKCDSDLESLAYHKIDSGLLVSACCRNKHLVLMAYDLEWNWLGDLELQVSRAIVSISAIPKEKLEAIFTPAEIRDMLACQQGQPYTRQNLYRARAKYEQFERLFGIKFNI
jgi:hypothetical protein